MAVITAHGTMDSAIDALKSGAFDFVTKPVELRVLLREVHDAVGVLADRQFLLPESPDLVILDLAMHGLHGIAVATADSTTTLPLSTQSQAASRASSDVTTPSTSAMNAAAENMASGRSRKRRSITSVSRSARTFPTRDIPYLLRPKRRA